MLLLLYIYSSIIFSYVFSNFSIFFFLRISLKLFHFLITQSAVYFKYITSYLDRLRIMYIYLGVALLTQCIPPQWYLQVGFVSLSQFTSGMNRPLSNRACSKVQGQTHTWAAKFRKKRSVRSQLLHIAFGQRCPWSLSH